MALVISPAWLLVTWAHSNSSVPATLLLCFSVKGSTASRWPGSGQWSCGMRASRAGSLQRPHWLLKYNSLGRKIIVCAPSYKSIPVCVGRLPSILYVARLLGRRLFPRPIGIRKRLGYFGSVPTLLASSRSCLEGLPCAACSRDPKRVATRRPDHDTCRDASCGSIYLRSAPREVLASSGTLQMLLM